MNHSTRQEIQASDIEHALSFVPADDRDTWLRMAMAIKTQLGNEGFAIWDHWSASAHNYNERDAQSSTGAYAKKLWLSAAWEGAGDHPYAKSKGIDWSAGAARGKASGWIIGQNTDCVIVPIRDLSTNVVQAVQCINADGAKQTFGSLSGNAFICGNTLDKSIRWFVVEGWADAVSMVFHHYDGNAVAFAACGKSSMEKLAGRVAEVFAPQQIIIMEDAA